MRKNTKETFINIFRKLSGDDINLFLVVCIMIITVLCTACDDTITVSQDADVIDDTMTDVITVTGNEYDVTESYTSIDECTGIVDILSTDENTNIDMTSTIESIEINCDDEEIIIDYDERNDDVLEDTFTIIETTSDETVVDVTTSNEITKEENIIEETTITETIINNEDYVVYKPSTGYIHRNTCRWFNSTCIRIENTEGLQSVKKCTECNPDMEILDPYVAPEPEQPVITNGRPENITYLKSFSRGTYYSGSYYSSNPANVKGGSGRVLIDGTIGDGTGIKGSIASNYIQRNYGYNRNGGRTLVYIECSQYPELNGTYYLDDSQGYNNEVVDFFYYYNSNCPFQYQGVVPVEAWLVD